MLFLQGTRDALANFGLIEGVVHGTGATLLSVPDADHSFHVPARSGRTDAQVLGAILDETVTWMRATLGFGAASPVSDQIAPALLLRGVGTIAVDWRQLPL